MNDLVADMLTRIQNAIMRKKETVEVVNTKLNAEILRILQEEDMVGEYEVGEKTIEVVLKYDKNEPVISKLTRVSKSGQRIYVTYKEILPVMNGRGINVISTSKGLMSGAMAKSQKLGGELICEVW